MIARIQSSSWDPHVLRTNFASALSDMYQKEVPLYGDLIQLVRHVDNAVIGSSGSLPHRNMVERHGAIRLGTPEEMRNIKRLFAVLDMHPVGYYDLSVAGLPLHGTAFRPVYLEALEKNPFRVFATLLRPDLLPADVSRTAKKLLSRRQMFPQRLLDTLTKIEESPEGVAGMSDEQASHLITDSLEIFRWHSDSQTSFDQYLQLKDVHPTVADIACFHTAHINHLTPRTLDIDMVQAEMIGRGMPAKDRIEGPPRRSCPVLLRQTSFLALEEQVAFRERDGKLLDRSHTARFGEVEQRGAALTRKGRELYDELLEMTKKKVGEPNATPEYEAVFVETFAQFPDTWEELRARELVFFHYTPSVLLKEVVVRERCQGSVRLEDLVSQGAVEFEAITYEDFLPLSAAGIFLSNVQKSTNGGDMPAELTGAMSRKAMEDALGGVALDEFDLYAQMQQRSIEECRRVLGLREIT